MNGSPNIGAVGAGRQNPGVGDVHLRGGLNCTSASPAASTFLTQFVFPWPSAIASTLPLR